MLHVLVVQQSTCANTTREIVQRTRCEDSVVPCLIAVDGWVRKLKILLTDPSEDASGVIVEHEGEGLRAGAHEDGVAEVRVEPVLTAGFDLLFAWGEIGFCQGGREGGGREVEVNCAAGGVFRAEFADDEHAPVTSLHGVSGIGELVH